MGSGDENVWEYPFQACAIDADCMRPEGRAKFGYFLCYFKMVALRALNSCRRPEGSWALGTRMDRDWDEQGPGLPGWSNTGSPRPRFADLLSNLANPIG